ncbi:MAG TPA: ATPase domain-containing protein [Chloroflexaceae bacterium]|nr:ATPase domain-containing protein [Chloroflexaceae bacterium]
MTNEITLQPTGVTGLDSVLNGGLTHPSLVLIVGAPGAGKTVLASQILFTAARQGLNALVMTSFSEGVEQYLQHMQSFSFFDPTLLGDQVQLYTLASQLTEEGATITSSITRTIRATGAKIVLLDGLQGVAPLMPETYSTRVLLAMLASQIRYLNVVVLVTMAGEARDPAFHAELTVADAAIGLRYSAEGRRHQRLLEVVKLRGRAQQPGLHSYQLDASGLRVFPRVEGAAPPAARPAPAERAPFQLPELDALLGGGPNVGSTMVLAGAPGVGKTLLGLYWALAGASGDATSLIVTFAEHPAQLERKADAFGLELRSATASGRVKVVRLPARDVNPDEVAALVLSELAAQRVTRVVIDDLRVLIDELGERARSYLSALNDVIYAANATALYLLEVAPFVGLRVDLTATPLAVLGDTVVVVQQYEIAGGLRRLLAVLRMRFSDFDRTIRELVLDAHGVRILTPDQSKLGLLTTGAELSGGVAPQEGDQ